MTNALKMARLVFDEPYCAKAAPIQEVFCNSKDKAYLNGMEDFCLCLEKKPKI